MYKKRNSGLRRKKNIARGLDRGNSDRGVDAFHSVGEKNTEFDIVLR